MNRSNDQKEVSTEDIIDREPNRELEKKISRGLRFANYLGLKNQKELLENICLIQALAELLISKGIIHYNELEQRKKAVAKSLKQSDEKLVKVYLADSGDKYEDDSQTVVDCRKRYPVCKGVCCKLWFALSAQDLNEGLVKWNFGQPYAIEQNPEGYCVHQDPSTFQCTIYDNRPMICRTYHCKNDSRIWKDYDNMILNPEIESGR